MIDIHSHILPGVDDGAKSEEESIAMAKAAVAEGITTLIATPHHRNAAYDNYREDIRMHVSILNDLLKERNIPLTVLAGQEVRVYGEMIEDFEHGDIQTLADSKYVLIEFPSDSVPQYAERFLYDLQIAGLRPIIAHPERNLELINNQNRMYDLIRSGAFAQVTAASIAGKFGKEIATFSYQLIEANLAHFIASDAHNTTTRGFFMKEAFEKIKETFGVEMYYTLIENSQLLLDDDVVNRYEPERIKRKRKKFFGLF